MFFPVVLAQENDRGPQDGQIFKALGVLRKGHVVEVRRSDLVASYVGQTGPKTKEQLKKAQHGILFIDEAYDLVRDDNDVFGKEALVELLAYMENHRNQLSVIIAGYPGDVKQFLDRNAGFASRFTETIHFENFAPPELLQIFDALLEEKKYTMSEEVRSQLVRLFEYWVVDADASFGNARAVRKLFEQMNGNQSNRLVSIYNEVQQGDPQLFAFEPVDIPDAERKKLGKKLNSLEDILDELDDLVGLPRLKYDSRHYQSAENESASWGNRRTGCRALYLFRKPRNRENDGGAPYGANF